MLQRLNEFRHDDLDIDQFDQEKCLFGWKEKIDAVEQCTEDRSPMCGVTIPGAQPRVVGQTTEQLSPTLIVGEGGDNSPHKIKLPSPSPHVGMEFRSRDDHPRKFIKERRIGGTTFGIGNPLVGEGHQAGIGKERTDHSLLFEPMDSTFSLLTLPRTPAASHQQIDPRDKFESGCTEAGAAKEGQDRSGGRLKRGDPIVGVHWTAEKVWVVPGRDPPSTTIIAAQDIIGDQSPQQIESLLRKPSAGAGNVDPEQASGIASVVQSDKAGYFTGFERGERDRLAEYSFDPRKEKGVLDSLSSKGRDQKDRIVTQRQVQRDQEGEIVIRYRPQVIDRDDNGTESRYLGDHTRKERCKEFGIRNCLRDTVVKIDRRANEREES